MRKIAGMVAVRQLSRGQVLYSERDEAPGLYIVSSGELRSVRQTANGREQVLSTERPFAVLAMAPVFDGGKCYDTVVADIPAEVLCIRTRDVHELCNRHSELLWNVTRVMSNNARHYAGLIEALALRTVDQRLAQYLLVTAGERSVETGASYTIELTLSRTEIASRIGSAREAVSRGLTHLQRRGLIAITGRRLVSISNLGSLAAFAGLDEMQQTTFN